MYVTIGVSNREGICKMLTRENMTNEQVIERLTGFVTAKMFEDIFMTDEREAIYKAIALIRSLGGAV